MPEAMMMNTNPVWSVSDHKPVNYFRIETLDGKFYDIPVITDDRTITDTDYLAFAPVKIRISPTITSTETGITTMLSKNCKR